jgi:hypothetical protein
MAMASCSPPRYGPLRFSHPKHITSMPSTRNPDWIDWRSSAARQILLEDLEPEGILFEKGHISPEQAWKFYSTLPEFSRVVFTQFEARLKDHRTQVNKKSGASQRDVQALAHDMALYPRQGHNGRGEPVFDLSAAKPLLREDVRNNLHATMVPSVFQQTRQEYRVFKPHIFKHRIYQEVRRQKYLHYLELKRAKLRHPSRISTNTNVIF